MAIGDELFLADKETLDLVKTDAETIIADTTTLKSDTTTLKSDTTTLKSDATDLKADTALIKTANAVGATYGDNLFTQELDATNLVVSLTGKYELLGLSLADSSASQVTIQIDGATLRKYFNLPAFATFNTSGLGIKSATSLKVYTQSNLVRAFYRLLP